MVKVKVDITGWKLWEHGVPESRLTVIKQVDDHIQPNGKHRAMLACVCNCGSNKMVIARGDGLFNGDILSCGCINSQKTIERNQQRKKLNESSVMDGHGVLITTNTKREVYFDIEDANKILIHTWYENGHGYPETCINGHVITMHKLLGYARYDHIDRNKLNNMKSNFRPCTHIENNRNKDLTTKNTSGIIGVSWDGRRNKWMATIKVYYKAIYLGRFENKNDAIRARLNAEVKYFGEFAPQQHLHKQYKINVDSEAQ